MNISKNYIPALCFMLLSMPHTADNNWGLRKDKNGIRVYSRSIEGSPIKELRSVMTVHSSLNAIIKLLMDVPACTTWVYHCKEAHSLKRLSMHEDYYYEETSAPWPISNRDLIIHSNWVQNESTKSIVVIAEATDNYLPEKTGIVRIKKFKSVWTVTPMPDKEVHIEYIVSVDPAGLLPAWLVNMASAEGPYQTSREMQKLLDLPKYHLGTDLVKEL